MEKKQKLEEKSFASESWKMKLFALLIQGSNIII